MFGMMEAMLGFLRRQVGLRNDAANPNGSLHAKLRALITVQRGISAAAGNITISPVDVNRTFILSTSKGSAGYVAARGDANGTLRYARQTSSGEAEDVENYSTYTATLTLSGGSTDLTTKAFSTRLINATTIYCDGPCEWQVINFSS